MHENSKLAFTRYAKQFFQIEDRVLEIGPDSDPSTYEAIVSKSTRVRWETVGLEKPAKKIVTSPYSYQYDSESFDVILSGQVLEHIRKPWLWIEECARLLKPGGHLITIVPVSWPYHEAPVDCWRIYPEGMKALHEHANLKTSFTWFGTLEDRKGRTNILPGRSEEYQPWLWVEKLTNLECVEVAFDTVSIAQKPVKNSSKFS